jgi:hypothetical protein
MTVKDCGHRTKVSQVCLYKNWGLPCQSADPLHHAGRTVAEVVEPDHSVTCRKKGDPSVGTDVAGSASEQDGGHASEYR